MSTKPDGPWKTADSVPKEIYTIPSSSPVYNVTYVTQPKCDRNDRGKQFGPCNHFAGTQPLCPMGQLRGNTKRAGDSNRAGNHSARNNARLPNFDRSARDSHAGSEPHGARHERNIRWA
jgi:hypothetical protein